MARRSRTRVRCIECLEGLMKGLTSSSSTVPRLTGEIERALANDPREPEEYLFEGVDLLQALIKDIIGKPAQAA